jgi:hypothetical protein
VTFNTQQWAALVVNGYSHSTWRLSPSGL